MEVLGNMTRDKEYIKYVIILSGTNQGFEVLILKNLSLEVKGWGQGAEALWKSAPAKSSTDAGDVLSEGPIEKSLLSPCGWTQVSPGAEGFASILRSNWTRGRTQQLTSQRDSQGTGGAGWSASCFSFLDQCVHVASLLMTPRSWIQPASASLHFVFVFVSFPWCVWFLLLIIIIIIIIAKSIQERI